MARPSAFERDFRDLHGEELDAISVGPGAYRAAASVPAIDRIGLRLTLGALGLFWAIFLTMALIAMLVIGGVAVWAAFTA